MRGITAGYSEIPIVNDVDLEVRRGQVVAVVGPNGAGKSTLLKAILGIARLLGGRIEVVDPLRALIAQPSVVLEADRSGHGGIAYHEVEAATGGLYS